jgi:superfamily II DNA or RNA helicase
MPRIFDNITTKLLPTLQEMLTRAKRADFCIGYFNLRGWRLLHEQIASLPGDRDCCRILVGMQRLPQEELRTALSIVPGADIVDLQTANRIRKQIANEFHQQLIFGLPSNQDESALRNLASQLREGRVTVKLFLKHPLHAKLYLLFREDPANPIVGYLGSSNFTFSGLSGQGELNIDVLDHDATNKLASWFEDRWNDRLCTDISSELATIIEESWAGSKLIPPYEIYIKMAYHLSQEARAGLSEFQIPRDFKTKLFEFQTAAVKIAAHHINKRGGVLIGDVVGLGKTLMAVALARIFEDDFGYETLILCPKNLVPMWEGYRDNYRLRAKVLSISGALGSLPELRRYRLVIIDESHNLRNRDGKRYRVIRDYIQANDSKCILLSATPYNRSYLDLSNQLRMFVDDDQDIGIRPEALLREIGETEFTRQHQCSMRSLAAFENSSHADDWRELMRLYLVRRTRSFIKDNYALASGDGRKYLLFENGEKTFFPNRIPKTAKFEVGNGTDQYSKLFSVPVVDAINALTLPRYGLGNYVAASPKKPPTQQEAKYLADLSRAGRRLMGFCRVNLFKRLESSGIAFIQSLERHVLRNCIVLHAIETGEPLPIGAQGAELLDSRFSDSDSDVETEDTDTQKDSAQPTLGGLTRVSAFESRAKETYALYKKHFSTQFKWLRADLFVKSLASDLKQDNEAIIKILKDCGEWLPSSDTKLLALHALLEQKHPSEKVLVFSQFADTVNYLETQLKTMGVQQLAGVTGDSEDPTSLAWRFSPESNEKREQVTRANELRVLVATDILSEGQNLQDCAIVVNYDLPWAIIRLIQRAGRVDRIGQKAHDITCYSFMPTDGVERVIRLRARVRRRLEENAEVVGADETFFEDEDAEQTILNLYHENAGILDGEDDKEVDLASHAYQIWKNAIEKDPKLEKRIAKMPDVVFSTREHKPTKNFPEGVLVYMRTPQGGDSLAFVDKQGTSITESQFEILKLAECLPNAAAIEHNEKHHDLVETAAHHIAKEEKRIGGQLGRPLGARFRTYERLKAYASKSTDVSPELLKAIDEIYRYTMRPSAIDTLNRQLKSGIDDVQLAALVEALRSEDRLCNVNDKESTIEPQIICSLGIFEK